MKGISTLVASVMLVLIAVATYYIVSSWLITTTEKETSTIRNSTREQLECQYGDLYIRSAVFDCANNCNSGTAHALNVTIVNSGKKILSLDRVSIVNTTGSLVQFTLPAAVNLEVGDIRTINNSNTESCAGINQTMDYIRVASTNCPNAYDNFDGSQVTFVNC